MNFRILLLSCSLGLAVSSGASAQTDNTPAQKVNPFTKASKTTSFGAMASVPVGKFSSTNVEDGGYAQTGWGLYFDSKSKLKNGLTFISHSTYSWVPLKNDELSAEFTKDLGTKTTVTGGKHLPFLTTLGIGYDYDPSAAISVGVSAQAGLMYNSFNAFDLTVYAPDNTTVLFSDNLKFDSQFSFAYVLGMHVDINIVKNLLDFQVFADYSSSKFNSTLRGSKIEAIKTTQQVQLVNVGGGLVFHTK